MWRQGVEFTADGRGLLLVDGANGVGGIKMPKVAAVLSDLLHVQVRNKPGDGELNHKCGAEHAQKSRTPPANFTAGVSDSCHLLPLHVESCCARYRSNFCICVCMCCLGVSLIADKNIRCCSVDGDADRVVYHYFDDEGNWRLLDGDAIACLCGVFFADQLAAAGLTVDPAKAGEANYVKLGLVQTAYVCVCVNMCVCDLATTVDVSSLWISYWCTTTNVKYKRHMHVQVCQRRIDQIHQGDVAPACACCQDRCTLNNISEGYTTRRTTNPR